MSNSTKIKPTVVIKLGSSQFLLKAGDKFKAEKINLPDKKKFSVTDVLLYADDKQTLIGTPTLSNVSVSLLHLGIKKDKKIRVARFKAKSRHRRVKGHRQQKSEFVVDEIKLKK